MSDLFLDVVPDDYIVEVAKVMAAANWHTYQVLTKRADRMRDLLRSKLAFASTLPHIWWGTSVEDRKYGVPRIDYLRAAPAIVRFLSVEPLLEDLGELCLDDIHWVIVGGESGAGARPLNREWVISLRAQCRRARVPFFFKQWGGVQKKKTGRELDGKTYDAMPTLSNNKVADTEVRKKLIELTDEASRAYTTKPALIPAIGRKVARGRAANAK
jgi:protein gp37